MSIELTRYLQIHTLKVYVHYPSVMFGMEVFDELIRKVFSSRLIVQAELILLDVSTHPVETYVKCFGVITAHVAGEDAVGGHAVGFYWCGRLRVAHFYEGCADGNILLAVE